jgi:hypothetical protein
MRNGAWIPPIALTLLLTAAGCAPTAFNVRDYGAKGDRKANDQAAIQAAVDACSTAGGGTVVLTPGDYLSGSIRLASNVVLRLDEGATLWASTDPAHYESPRSGHLLLAEKAERVAVIGRGVINGQGAADYGARWGAPDVPAFRTGILLFQQCRGVAIRNVTILYSDAWALHLKRCEDVVIDGVTIRNNPHRLNSDGIDPNSCRNVRISNCRIVAGDDCIVLKATEAFPCENIEVTDCVLESTTAAIKFGTESYGDFRNVRIWNCTVVNSPVGVGFYLKDGGTMERIVISNIGMEICDASHHAVAPIFMDIERRNADSKVGRIHDVTLENIRIHCGSGALIQGMPESPIENLSLRNIIIRVDKPDDYAKRSKPVGGRRTTHDDRDTCYARLPAYMAIAHVRGLALENIRVEISAAAFKAFPRSALAGRDIDGAVIRNLLRVPDGEAGGVRDVDFVDCRNIRMENGAPGAARK